MSSGIEKVIHDEESAAIILVLDSVETNYTHSKLRTNIEAYNKKKTCPVYYFLSAVILVPFFQITQDVKWKIKLNTNLGSSAAYFSIYVKFI